MKNDLYSNLVCALTHNINVCEHCKKCDKTGADARIKLVEELAKETGYEVPWVVSNIEKNTLDEHSFLTKEEENYLRSVVAPYRDRVTAIILEEGLFGYPEGYGFIRIRLHDPNIVREGLEDTIILPTFKIGTKYKNLQPGKEYTLKELKIFQESEK